MVDQEIIDRRKELIAALRSDKYTQIYGNYFNTADKTRCCFVGLLMSTAPKYTDYYERLGFTRSKWITANDRHKFTFKQFADYIERHLNDIVIEAPTLETINA